MENQMFMGLALTVLGGVMQGSFTLPMKFTPRWTWENTWLAYSAIGLLILPLVIAALTVPHLMDVYLGSEGRTLALAMFFGLGWGAGSTLFGTAVSRIGMALAFALVIGLTSALGSLVPMALLHPEELITAKGKMIIGGLGVVMLGLYCCARAGKLKAAQAGPESSVNGRSGFRTGLLLCLVSGTLSPMLNFSLAFGRDIAERAVSLGAKPENATNAIWALAVCSGFLVNALYCFYLLFRNKSWHAFRQGGTLSHWLMATVMGALWMFGISIYGTGAARVGGLGPMVGWPLFMTSIIVTANLWGLLTGEWKGVGSAPLRMILSGVILLVLAIFLIGYGGTL
jgi:L-rhamnose-H+ transport protein